MAPEVTSEHLISKNFLGKHPLRPPSLACLFVYIVQNYFPYSSSHGTLNYIRPFARTNYLYSSFVPSVISLWNNLPDSV